jgi:hypothetical protein
VRITLAIALTLAFGASAATAQAASISLVVSADPAEEQAFPVTVSGTADVQNLVEVFIRPAGGAACAATGPTQTGTLMATTHLRVIPQFGHVHLAAGDIPSHRNIHFPDVA